MLCITLSMLAKRIRYAYSNLTLSFIQKWKNKCPTMYCWAIVVSQYSQQWETACPRMESVFLSVASCSGTSNHSPLPYLLQIIIHCGRKQIVPYHIYFWNSAQLAQEGIFLIMFISVFQQFRCLSPNDSIFWCVPNFLLNNKTVQDSL